MKHTLHMTFDFTAQEGLQIKPMMVPSMGTGGSLSAEIQDMGYSQPISQSDHFKVPFNCSQSSHDFFFP